MDHCSQFTRRQKLVLSLPVFWLQASLYYLWVPAQHFSVIIFWATPILALFCLHGLLFQTFIEIKAQCHKHVSSPVMADFGCCCAIAPLSPVEPEAAGQRGVLVSILNGSLFSCTSCCAWLGFLWFFICLLVEPGSAAVSVLPGRYYVQVSFQVETRFQLMKTRLGLHGFRASSTD